MRQKSHSRGVRRDSRADQRALRLGCFKATRLHLTHREKRRCRHRRTLHHIYIYLCETLIIQYTFRSLYLCLLGINDETQCNAAPTFLYKVELKQ